MTSHTMIQSRTCQACGGRDFVKAGSYTWAGKSFQRRKCLFCGKVVICKDEPITLKKRIPKPLEPANTTSKYILSPSGLYKIKNPNYIGAR